MRGADRSLNARIVVKYIDRVSIGMEINRQRISPYGKCIYCSAHTQTHIEMSVRSVWSARERESERDRLREKGKYFCLSWQPHIEIKIDSIFRRKSEDLKFFMR